MVVTTIVGVDAVVTPVLLLLLSIAAPDTRVLTTAHARQ
jgi:hypothetical protein